VFTDGTKSEEVTKEAKCPDCAVHEGAVQEGKEAQIGARPRSVIKTRDEVQTQNGTRD
jgi:hypothetical protein